MKNLFTCAALCILLLSCKKDTEKTPEPPDQQNAKSFEVTFNISEFTQHVQVSGASKGNSISDAPLKDFADHFTYIAYRADGKEVSRIKQDLASGNATRVNNPEFYPNRPPEEFAGQQVFGCIKDSLAAGEYTIVMTASKKEFHVNARTDDWFAFDPITQANFYYDRGLDSWSRAEDTFFKKFTLTVENEDSQQTVALDRIVGKVEINIQDSKPGTSYKFLFVNENEAFKFLDEKPFSGTSDIQNEEYLQAVSGKANLTYSKFLINTETPIDVIIKVFENGQLSATKTVEDVRFYKNKRTILTGNIYTQKANSTGFTVTVNEEFDADTGVVNF